MGDLVDIRDLVAQVNGLYSLNVSPINVCSSIDLKSVAGQLGWLKGI